MDKKFDKLYLINELGVPFDPDEAKVKILESALIGKTRWHVQYRITFRLVDQPENEAWQTVYNRGATESQDCEPWEYEDEVRCTLVHLVEKKAMVWEAKPDA